MQHCPSCTTPGVGGVLLLLLLHTQRAALGCVCLPDFQRSADLPIATSGKTRQFSNLYLVLEGYHFTVYILYPSELAQHSYLPTYRYLPGPTKATTGVFDFFFVILFHFFSF